MPDGLGGHPPRVRRVLHVSPYMHPLAGGPPVAIARWAEYAVAHGWRARVLSTPAMSRNCGRDLLTSAEGRYDLSLLPSELAALYGEGRSQLNGLVRDADLVHLHTMWCPLNALVARSCRRQSKAYVISPHGMLDPYSLGIKSRRKRAYLHAIESRNIRGAAGVLFTADEERDLAIAQIGHVPSARVVALGTDAPITPRLELAAQFRSSHSTLDRQKLVTFLGRLHPKKRPDAVIRALPALRAKEPDAAVLMIGSGDPAYVASLAHLAEELDVRDRVHFLGYHEGSEKWGALAASSVFVLPSQQENFAIAVAEALQSGVPVLITDKINIWREVLGAGAGLLLDDQRLVADIARHAATLLGDAERRDDMGRKAQALAMSAYTWPGSAKSLCATYDAFLTSQELDRLGGQR